MMILKRLSPAIAIGLLVLFWSCASTGSTPNKLYFSAESSYQALRQDAAKQKYRSYWLDCIRQFEAVYETDPDGPWAAAGLFMAGTLYQELYGHSYKPSDLEKARSIYKRIIDKYPSSAYRKKAGAALDKIEVRRKQDERKARKLYFTAESCYQSLENDAARQKYRSYWLDCIRQFEAVYETDPEGPWAAAGLYMTAKLYQGLYRHSYKPEDLDKAKSIFNQIISHYASSAYADRARTALDDAGKSEDAITVITRQETTSGEVTTNDAADVKAPAPGDPVTVTGIRYWSNPEYTRVVIDANQETNFQNNLLNKDPSINQPHQRLYVDLNNSRLGNNIQKQIPIDDTLLKDVRAGQYDPETVRVVVDIKSFENYNIFSLKNPFRIVIDVRGEAVADSRGGAGIPDIAEGDTASIARQLALGVRRIVIDPGHGGKDCGAPGSVHGVHEKEVVLAIAKRLAEEIRKSLNCEVLMTRNDDTYLTLEERTAIANTKKADLFISIHANASRNTKAFGIETYFLNLTTDDESIAVAARENATSEKNISELQTILNDLMRNAKVNESSRLATYVQNSLCRHLDKSFTRIYDKGVKQAPFYVLLGAQMPSVLIETAFISNPRECRRLKDPEYQQALCDGIVSGLKHYIEQTRPTAYLSPE